MYKRKKQNTYYKLIKKNKLPYLINYQIIFRLKILVNKKNTF
jgi:hypothetical protein